MLYYLHYRSNLGEQNMLKDDERFMVFNHLDDFEGIGPVGIFQLVARDKRDGFLEGEFDIELARHGENGFAVFFKAVRLGSPACPHRTKG